MRQNVHNWPEMVEAVRVMDTSDTAAPRVLVLFDSLERTYRFVLSEHGLAKMDSDRKGDEP
jgi:hypothetical protein